MAAVRVALVGCGAIAKHHLKALQRSSYASEVTAVVDVDRKAAEDVVQQLPSGSQCKVRTTHARELNPHREHAVTFSGL